MAKITVRVTGRPRRYIILRGTGKRQRQIRFPGGLTSFRSKATADIVAYWLRKPAPPRRKQALTTE